MATTVAVLEAQLRADTRDFDRGVNRSEGRWRKFGGVLKRGALAAAAGVGALGVISVRNASDLEESLNKATVVFKGNEKQVIKWSQSTAAGLGLSQAAALESAGSIGAMLVPMGLARGKAAEMSMEMVQLAGDMASFNNEDPTEMLDRIRAGLSGEMEPLKKFGAVLSESRVKQEAYNMGLAEHGAILTDQQKIQARYSLLMKDTADQQGDFTRTSGSMANQQRILKAEFTDLSAKLGQKLLPIVVKVMEYLIRFINWADGVNGAERISKAFDGVTTRLGEWRDGTIKIWEAVKRTFERFGLEMKKRALQLVLGIVEPFSHLPGSMGKWARDAKDKVNLELGKIERQIKDLALEARKASAKPYKITFHTNAGAVAEHIDIVSRSARRAAGDFGSFGLGRTSLVALGQQLQSMGFSVGEHPAFGGVSPVHVPGSYHYQGRALDINWPGAGEAGKLDWLNARLRRMPGVKELLWRTAGHFDHLHVAMDRGGVVPGRRGAPVPILAHGGETMVPTHRPGFSAGSTYNFNGPVLDGQELLRFIRKEEAKYKRRGG